MSGANVSFEGDLLRVGDKSFRLEHPVKDAFTLATLVIVLFNADSVTRKFGQFANLVAIDPSTGEQVWKAELPSSTTGDHYYKIASHDPLVAYSAQSFVCTIDASTGRIKDKAFVK
jgi:outer membrane protein assembly factor BamB